MDGLDRHELGNLLHQIISYSHMIEEDPHPLYAEKIRECAFAIDALATNEEHLQNYRNASQPASVKLTGVGDLENKKVLIVDDIEENRMILKKIFTTLKCHVYDAQDGEEAVTVCEAITPDIVTMDIMMQMMDGFEATRLIKKMGMDPYMIAISALKDHSHEDIALFDVWLPKPFTTRHIVEALAPFIYPAAHLKEHRPAFISDITTTQKRELIELLKSRSISRLERYLETLEASPLKAYLIEQTDLLNFDVILKLLEDIDAL